MKVSVGYPDAEATEAVLMEAGVRDRAALSKPIATTEHVERMIASPPRCTSTAPWCATSAGSPRPPASHEQVALGLSTRG